MREYVLGDPVVEHALAVDHIMLLLVERGSVILEELDQGARLGTFIQDLGLAFIDTATTVHRGDLCQNAPAEAATLRHDVGSEPCLADCPRFHNVVVGVSPELRGGKAGMDCTFAILLFYGPKPHVGRVEPSSGANP